MPAFCIEQHETTEAFAESPRKNDKVLHLTFRLIDSPTTALAFAVVWSDEKIVLRNNNEKKA